MNLITPKDLKGFVEGRHQPYTDYNQEIIDWLTENNGGDFRNHQPRYCHIFTQSGSFYTHYLKYEHDVYYTNEQFKEWIGMTNCQTNKEFKLSDLVSGKHVVEYRDGSRRLVLDVGWVGDNGYRSIDGVKQEYEKTMENHTTESHDVVKVYDLVCGDVFKDLLSEDNLSLVWERKEAPVETAQEKAKKEAEARLIAQLNELSQKIEALQRQAEAIKESVGKM